MSKYHKGFAPIYILAGLVIIAFFVWATLTQKLDIRKKAAQLSPSLSKIVLPDKSPNPTPTSITKKVAVIIFNPILESSGNQTLIQYKNWNRPSNLDPSYIQDIKTVSNNFVNYTITIQREVDAIPRKADGFSYTDSSYLACLNNSSQCHQPDIADYNKILTDFSLCEKRNSGEIDEVWLWGGPYFGYYESRLAGPNAFWYNSPPLTNTTCKRLLPIMGFNYERGVSEMIEDMGHRTESVMARVWGNPNPHGTSPWDKFTIRDIDIPGRSACGNIHYAPNSTSDYDWANPRTVVSSCDDWYSYPFLQGTTKNISCSEWNCSGYEYKKWWLMHLPKTVGRTDSKLNNWWRYIVDYEAAVAELY